jgi:hypothetical protein
MQRTDTTSGPRVRTRRRQEGGAAAVEFALVSSIFFILLFGILQYGLYFNDALNTRQGVREGARRAVVEDFGFASGCTSGTNSARLLCSTRKEIGAVTGPTYAKVVATPSPWKQGSGLLVCGLVHSKGVMGIVPMPDDGWIRSKTQMTIEQQTQAATWTDSADDLAGTGQDWSWCTS